MDENSKNIQDSNADLWDREEFIASYDPLKGWNDVGEMNALLSIAPAVRGKAVLDVGVGTGRTTALLRLLTDDYVGIDYSPAMIQRAKAALPGIDLRVGDVRDLQDFADASKSLVWFSYNGLDSLDHDFRAGALANMARVVAPGGYLVYSTINLDSPHARRKPWTVPERPAQTGLEGVLRWGARLAQSAVHGPSNMKNLRRSRLLTRRGQGWVSQPSPGSRWRLLQHFITLGQAKTELAATGLSLERVMTWEGLDVSAQDSTDSIYFQMVARRPLN